jgi:hypothetical protein
LSLANNSLAVSALRMQSAQCSTQFFFWGICHARQGEPGAAVDGVRLGGGEEGDRFSRVVENEVFVVLVVVHGSGLWGCFQLGCGLVACVLTSACSCSISALRKAGGVQGKFVRMQSIVVVGRVSGFIALYRVIRRG